MTRYVALLLHVGLAAALVAVSRDLLKNYSADKDSLYVFVSLIIIIAAIMVLITWLFSIIFAGGRAIPATFLLSRGQVYRLVCISSDWCEDEATVLLDFKVKKPRHVRILFEDSDEANENVRNFSELTAGHYYSYVGWGRIKPVTMGKL